MFIRRIKSGLRHVCTMQCSDIALLYHTTFITSGIMFNCSCTVKNIGQVIYARMYLLMFFSLLNNIPYLSIVCDVFVEKHARLWGFIGSLWG